MDGEVRYLTDDRDLPEDRLRELVIAFGGNGDWYVQIARPGRPTLEGVRLCNSGGVATTAPGVTAGVAQAYRALKEAEAGHVRPAPSYDELLAEVLAWRKRIPTHEFRYQDDCIAQKLED